MLPESQNRPSSFCEDPRRLKISRFVLRYLFGPVPLIGFRHSSVNRATVPETAVDEDGDSGFAEHDVCSPP